MVIEEGTVLHIKRGPSIKTIIESLEAPDFRSFSFYQTDFPPDKAFLSVLAISWGNTNYWRIAGILKKTKTEKTKWYFIGNISRKELGVPFRGKIKISKLSFEPEFKFRRF